MQNRIWCAALGLTMALGLAWWVTAQEPSEKKQEPPRGFEGRRSGPGDRFGPGRRGRFGPADGLPPGGGVERAVDDLKLSGPKKEQAEAVLKAYQDNVGKLMDLARSDLMLRMQDVLGEQDLKKFNEALARRPGPAFGRGGPRGGFRGGRGLTVEQIVERIMSFDKNGDGKITRDELPERMQHLVEKGDANKDGALDKEEVKKLAADLARDGSFRGFDGRGRRGDGFRPGPGGPFRPGPEGGLERALGALNLPERQLEKADAALKAHQETVRTLMDVAHADLLVKMKGILDADQFKNFKAALDRGPGLGPIGPGGRPPRGGPGDLETKVDQLQKELEELRREIRR